MPLFVVFPPPDVPVAMDDRLMQEQRGKRRDVFTEEIKRDDCSVTGAEQTLYAHSFLVYVYS